MKRKVKRDETEQNEEEIRAGLSDYSGEYDGGEDSIHTHVT